MAYAELLYVLWGGEGPHASFIRFVLLMMLLIIIPFYIYSAVVLMTIAKKTKTKDAWRAWVPITSIYLMTQIAKVPGWVTLVILLALIPFIGVLIFLAVYIWLWWKIAEARKQPGWMALLMIIPIVNLVIMGLIAWKD